ncbi:4Fe-4S dicluster domain-containing protein [Trichlorobacter sp.]|jgi:Pyruvate/2-oxoacid:ferredoxin oxidoreductase delta subunit|uniref:4Fe-4S dicluster domain-containing protein n=1 Tax=Trichlorobacter sp. TaxID=2911007 RepID=UPI002A359D1D|nr:4Fe-4S dicluster domain-containing protein [Trichlorobacter sp.]MDY0383653.1 4Fe-4S binding protein [Trichlorobacter sp.]
MTLTRKDFFRQGFFSLGDVLLKKTGLTHQSAEQELEELDALPDDCRRVATLLNERCLARGCGCFSCVERCEQGAISVSPGQGVRIDGSRCNGCGSCWQVCPVQPKAIRLQSVKNELYH